MTRLQVATHPVAGYFAVTIEISWGGALLAIGGSGRNTGNHASFASALIAMLAGPSG